MMQSPNRDISYMYGKCALIEDNNLFCAGYENMTIKLPDINSISVKCVCLGCVILFR